MKKGEREGKKSSEENRGDISSDNDAGVKTIRGRKTKEERRREKDRTLWLMHHVNVPSGDIAAAAGAAETTAAPAGATSM